jgi:hypothetical protein
MQARHGAGKNVTPDRAHAPDEEYGIARPAFWRQYSVTFQQW